MSEIKLLPCPFCGGAAVQFHAKSEELGLDLGYRFFCPQNCCMQVGFYPTKEDAIKAWNTRKPLERIVERLEERNKNAEKNWEEFVNFDSVCAAQAYYDAIQIARKEGGLNEIPNN